MLVATGAAAFRFLVLRGVGEDVKREAGARAARLGRGAAFAALLAALVRAPLQAVELRDPLSPILPQARALILHTWWGGVWGVQLVLAVCVAIFYSRARAGGKADWALAGGSSVLLAMTLPMSGHAIGSETWTALAVSADAVHVLSASVWLGAMLVLAAALAQGQEPERAPVKGALVAAFSPLALAAAGGALTSGLVSAWLHLRMFSDLWTTPYGSWLFRKLVGVGLMAACGAYNWKKAGPRLIRDGEVGPIRRSIRLELVLGALVLFATAVLVASPLPGDQ
ncbi:MAG: copper resistance D family protein [Gemmatimonadales bacterium]